MSNGLIRYLTDKNCRIRVNAAHGLYKSMSDKDFLKLYFKARIGTDLDLDHPKTFNEKLQWLKLYDRNPLYTTLVDKYAVKEYIAQRIGEEYVVPLYGVWDRFEDIDFAKLPDRFVLKCTHDSGGLVICKDKNTLDKSKARKKINRCLKRSYYAKYREWPYKNVKPRIIAEQYMEDSLTNELRDYKFFCFNGVVKAMFIATNRQSSSDTTFDFFDPDFRHLDLRQGHPNADTPPEKPVNFELMKTLSEKLSEGLRHVRVDFYEVDGKVYFGEMTFFHFNGCTPFDPPQWDLVFGDWLKLPAE